MRPIIFLVALCALLVSNAYAQVYKCETEKGKIAYSDTECKLGILQTDTGIQANPPNSVQTEPPGSKDAITRQLDSAVKSAIAAGDLIRAQALASTQEQREWVIAAKKEAAKNPASGRTEADYLAERANSAECLKARRNLEEEANIGRDPSLLDAKTNLMHAACGTLVQNDVPAYGVYGGSRYPYPLSAGGYRPLPPSSGPVPPPAYDRFRSQPPFGSRFIRPEDGIYR